jgi:hypoxanthine phosphoribosyltransferase
MKSYDYATRKGVRELSWDDFYRLSTELAEQLAARGVEAVVGIARAGLFPATQVAIALRRELYPARITRRVNDIVTHRSPVWVMPVSPQVKGKVVAVVDEIADTGETLALVAQATRELGAREVVTATLACHTWSTPRPDVVGLVTDELVIFPWDRQVLIEGKWQPHPEIVEALSLQQPKP